MHCKYELVYRFNHILIYCYVSVRYTKLLSFSYGNPPLHVLVVQLTTTDRKVLPTDKEGQSDSLRHIY